MYVYILLFKEVSSIRLEENPQGRMSQRNINKSPKEILIKLNEKYPRHYGILRRLIFIYENKNDLKTSQLLVDSLYSLKHKGNEPFPRCEFRVGKYYVRGYECFGLRTMPVWKTAPSMIEKLRFIFKVFNRKNKTNEIFRISLGSYTLTDIFMNKKSVKRQYHLDGYFKNGHETYKFYDGCPSWKRVKGRVKGILKIKNEGNSGADRESYVISRTIL